MRKVNALPLSRIARCFRHRMNNQRCILAFVLSLSLTPCATADVWYSAELSPIGEDVPHWVNGLFSGSFIVEGNPPCSTDSDMHVSVTHQTLEGALTAVVLRLEDQHGEVVLRMPAGDSWLSFGPEQCELLTAWSDPNPWDEPATTPLYVVLETSTHPDGALGGRLGAALLMPTLTTSWGEIKRQYRLDDGL